jgi:hypothetical protein
MASSTGPESTSGEEPEEDDELAETLPLDTSGLFTAEEDEFNEDDFDDDFDEDFDNELDPEYDELSEELEEDIKGDVTDDDDLDEEAEGADFEAED